MFAAKIEEKYKNYKTDIFLCQKLLFQFLLVKNQSLRSESVIISLLLYYMYGTASPIICTPRFYPSLNRIRTLSSRMII